MTVKKKHMLLVVTMVTKGLAFVTYVILSKLSNLFKPWLSNFGEHGPLKEED